MSETLLAIIRRLEDEKKELEVRISALEEENRQLLREAAR